MSEPAAAGDGARLTVLAFVLITCATVLGFAATDLVLPAIPGLPAALGGTPEQAQYVLAAYAAGVAVGLLGFGELGARGSQRPLLAGVWLLSRFSWQASFAVIGGLALLLGIVFTAVPAGVFPPRGRARTGSYLSLLRERRFLRFGLSQAFTLGALLVIVMGAPAVIVGSLQGSLSHFIAMQVMGVASFIVAANTSGRLAERFGAERLVMAGSLLSAGGACAILVYALAGGADPRVLAVCFVPVNLGLGLRGPTGFMLAIVAAGGDDARGAALVILAILLTAALGTAGVAPWIAQGLLPLAATAAAISLAAVLVLWALGRSTGPRSAA